jgi:hypothetical protein
MPFSHSSNDRPRQQEPSRLLRRIFSIVSVGALITAPVAALALWLLLTDPLTASAVMERGDLMPVLKALALVFGKALKAVMTLL